MPTDVTKGLQLGVMTSKHWIRRSLVIAALAAAAVGVIPPSLPSASAQVDGGLAAGGEYHPVTPSRIFDTRGAGINDTSPLGKKPTSSGGSSFNMDILGQGGIPGEVDGVNRDVLAVVLNITVANPTRAGYLSIAPTGSPEGVSSLINFASNTDVPNLAVVGVGTGGGLTATIVTPEGAGEADVLVDVFGWISTSAFPDESDSGARFVPVGPGRIFDTRTAQVTAGMTAGQPLGSQAQVKLPIRGAASVNPTIAPIVPNSPTVTGVMVNVTAVNDVAGSQGTFVAATPEPVPAGTEPSTSVTNVAPGQIKANMAIVPLGADGSINLFNRSGPTHLIIDVLGYLVQGEPATTRAGRVIPLVAPFRAFDTRQVEFGQTPLGFKTQEDWSFQKFTQSVELDGAPLGPQSAIIGNLTGTGLARVHPTVPVSTYLTIYPADVSLPNSSNINVTEGATVPNMSLLRYGSVDPDGTGPEPPDPYVIRAYNDNGSLHYLLDVYAVVLAD
jgi:hypothetical protein